MKTGKEHRVPLSTPALTIVEALYQVRISDYVFAGQAKGRPLSNMAFAKLMVRMKADQYTPHGFRSAFRDWAGDATPFHGDVAEQALAHQVGDATERAYRRADALDKRRKLMTAWADYCATPRAARSSRCARETSAMTKSKRKSGGRPRRKVRWPVPTRCLAIRRKERLDRLATRLGFECLRRPNESSWALVGWGTCRGSARIQETGTRSAQSQGQA